MYPGVQSISYCGQNVRDVHLFIITNTLTSARELTKELLQTGFQSSLVIVRTANELNATNKSLN